MNKSLIFTLLSFFLIAACETDPTDRKSFEWDLRGFWESNDTSVYKGKLSIEHNTITVSGYDEAQTRYNQDDARRPFNNIPKGIPFSGYSEDGKIFITRGGVLQDGIPYEIHSEQFGQYRLLYIIFGGRTETLLRDSD